MIRSTAFVHLPSPDPAAIEAIAVAFRGLASQAPIEALEVQLPAERAAGAGQLMVLGAFSDVGAWQHTKDCVQMQQVVLPTVREAKGVIDWVRYEQGPIVLREPGLRDGVQRTLLVRVDPAAAPDAVERFEHDVAAMPDYIDEIRNCSLSRVNLAGRALGPAWTHVWEQEFHTMEGLTGPYMDHAFHWGVVDRWFDPQSPTRLVESPLVHAMCPLTTTILGR